MIGGVLGRLAAGNGSSSKLLRAGLSAAAVTVRSVWRVLHLLFLEVTGFLFICFAVVFGGVAVREYHAYTLRTVGPGKAALAAVFAVMFLWFGVSSFWRAKRRQRSSV